MRSVLRHSDIVLATFTMMNVILTTLPVPAWGRLLIEPINKTVPRPGWSPRAPTRAHNSDLQFREPRPPRYDAVPRFPERLCRIRETRLAVAITILRVLITTLARREIHFAESSWKMAEKSSLVFPPGPLLHACSPTEVHDRPLSRECAMRVSITRWICLIVRLWEFITISKRRFCWRV